MLRQLITLLPPETAHTLTLDALRWGLGPSISTPTPSVPLFGKLLPNRVGLSGGADKNAVALAGWRKMGFGFVEAGTVTLNPRTGNAGPRIWRLRPQQSMVNWMGLPNLGLAAVAANLHAFRQTKEGQSFCVGVSLASPDGKAEEFFQMAQTLAQDADFFTLNASCPNVADHAASALQGLVEQLRQAKLGAGTKPVLVKLGPTKDMDVLQATVAEFVQTGVDGFIACNTVPPAAKDLLGSRCPSPWPSRDGQSVGGYSGPDLFPISLNMVKNIRAQIGPNMPVIGVGGISSVEQAQEMIAAGATAIQIYTALVYQGPTLIRKLQVVR